MPSAKEKGKCTQAPTFSLGGESSRLPDSTQEGPPPGEWKRGLQRRKGDWWYQSQHPELGREPLGLFLKQAPPYRFSC